MTSTTVTIERIVRTMRKMIGRHARRRYARSDASGTAYARRHNRDIVRSTCHENSRPGCGLLL